MAISLGSNISALSAQRKLAQGTAALSETFERLSSGQRINRAKDDAAGLSIAEALNAKSRVFSQGMRNLSDGLSATSIADGAFGQLTDILVRLSELAEQSANGTYSFAQRKVLDTEAQKLSDEYSRIIDSTAFNGLQLLDGSVQEIRLQGGFGVTGSLAFSIGSGGTVGTGQFSSSQAVATGLNNTHGVALGDVDGDGKLDLVSAGYDGSANGAVTVQFGTGTGTFGAATSYSIDYGFFQKVQLADLNNDSRLDLITATSGGNAVVRLGTGGGSFGAAATFATENLGSYDLAVVDINKDGKVDLITAGQGTGGGYATVRLGDGVGSFGAATSFAMETAYSRDVELADLNSDGNLDLITAGNSGGAGFATVRLGNGSGGFGGSSAYATETSESRALQLADVDGNGTLDLITGGISGSDGYITVRLGSGTGTFGAALSTASEARQTNSIVAGDFNGDGILDLISAGYDDTFNNGTITTRLGNGSGTFAASYSVASSGGSEVDFIAVGDLDSDGVLDVATDNRSSSAVHLASALTTVAGVQDLDSFSLLDAAGSKTALDLFKETIAYISNQRGGLGAFQSRLSVAISNLDVARENFTAAASRIKDVDVANEAANLTRFSILQQAASSILAQANQQPAIALQLLGG